MEEKINTKQGSLNISEDVIRTIVRRSVTEFKGTKISREESVILKRFFSAETDGNIKVKLTDDVVGIEIKIDVKNGLNVISLSEDLQRKIKSDVQNMTGITVSGINIKVDDIIFEDNKND